jgi:hypothetical protein
VIASAISALSLARFRAACRHPLRAQASQLQRILGNATDTDAGRRHRFAALARIRDPRALARAYREEVPVRDASAMKAELDAVYAGRWQALCPSPPLWFAMTAGSTGEFKYVPVTAEYRREVARCSLIFQGALEAAFPELRRMRTQFLVGSAEGGLSPAGVPQGFASGFNYRNLPGFVRRRFVMPYWAFTLDDAGERAYAAGRMLAAEPRLGALCAISPVNLINVRAALQANAERLLHDVATGGLSVRGRAAVAGSWSTRPDPARARLLRNAWRASGELPIRELFPALRVLVCWQGGNMSYYLRELREAFGVERTFEFPVSASEAVFAVPTRPDVAGGALAVTSHYLEFLPGGDPGAEALRADELEPGREYGIVVTTGGGLYRYDMEDIVRVTGFADATPIIEFVSKRGRRVSISNERITEEDVTRAMERASERCGCWLPEFLLVPCSDRRYRLVLDGASVAGGEERLQVLGEEMEAQLRLVAMGYDFEREDALLDPVEVVVTEPGVLRGWLARRQERGALPNAQVKPNHLATEFDLHRSLAAEVMHAA